MTRNLRALTLAVLATVLAVSSGCSSSSGSSDTSSSSGSKNLDKITYVTAFGAFGRDAFAWVAKDKGYFKDAGIDVTVQKGAAGDANLTALASGKAQFVSLDFTGATISAGKKTFTDWRAIAAVQQQTLVSVMSLPGKGISQPRDLAHKKIAAAAGSVNQKLFPAYAKLAGFDASSVTFVNSQPTQLNALLVGGQVDALSTFLLSQDGLKKAAGGKTPVVLPYSNYLTDLFGNVIVATPELMQKNPDLVKRFRDALLKGLKYSIDHPDEAAAIMNKAEPTGSTVAAAVSEIKLMTPYVTPSGGAPIGAMDEQKVARSIAILESAGLVPSGMKPADILAPDFTPKA